MIDPSGIKPKNDKLIVKEVKPGVYTIENAYEGVHDFTNVHEETKLTYYDHEETKSGVDLRKDIGKLVQEEAERIDLLQEEVRRELVLQLVEEVRRKLNLTVQLRLSTEINSDTTDTSDTTIPQKSTVRLQPDITKPDIEVEREILEKKIEFLNKLVSEIRYQYQGQTTNTRDEPSAADAEDWVDITF